MSIDREKLLLDVDSDLKKSKGFVVAMVNQSGKITIYDYYEGLNDAEKIGLTASLVDFGIQKSRGDWDTKKEYKGPEPE